MFPVLGVNFLGNGTKTIESTWFTDVADLVLNSVRETRIEVMTQTTIAISPNLGCDLVEVDHIAVDVMGVLHMEMIELMLGISNGVMGTKSGLEFYNKLSPAGHPQWMCIRVFHSY